MENNNIPCYLCGCQTTDDDSMPYGGEEICGQCFENKMELDDYAIITKRDQDDKCYICRKPIGSKWWSVYWLGCKLICRGECCEEITPKTPFFYALGAFCPVSVGKTIRKCKVV